MPVRIYRLTSTQTNTSVGQASTVVVARGKIKQILLTSTMTPAAGAGRHSFELAVNNTANGNAETATGAPSEVIAARQSHSWPAGAGAVPMSALNTVIPCDIPVIPGNNLCINVLNTTTSPTLAFMGADVHVLE